MSKMTRREFSKIVGVTALATSAAHTAFGSVANDVFRFPTPLISANGLEGVVSG